MRWSRLCANAVVFLFVSVVPALAAPPLAIADLRIAPMPPLFIAPMPRLFDTQEIFHGDTSPFKHWTDMLRRADAEFAAAPASCTDRRPECAMNEWSQLVARLAPLPVREKVIRANVALNAVPYVLSAHNWGRADYWEAPLEFLTYGGQCQDYAIAKYMLLLQAGVPADKMRIVVLRATARGEDHAVLVVNIDDEALMLDDERIGIIPADTETFYSPYYSINQIGWWQHIAPNAVQPAERQARSPSRIGALFSTAAHFTLGPWRSVARMIELDPHLNIRNPLSRLAARVRSNARFLCLLPHLPAPIICLDDALN